jgi:protoheme ferro-lyase
VDCTETLYDIKIALRNKMAQTHHNVSARVTYISCLNDSEGHQAVITQIIRNELAR